MNGSLAKNVPEIRNQKCSFPIQSMMAVLIHTKVL